MCICADHGVTMQVDAFTNQDDRTFIQTICPYHGVVATEEQTECHCDEWGNGACVCPEFDLEAALTAVDAVVDELAELEELAVPEFSRAYNHDMMRPERNHDIPTVVKPTTYDWTAPHWAGTVKTGGYANLVYTCQVTHGDLVTIG